jgi:hypothetical protein
MDIEAEAADLFGLSAKTVRTAYAGLASDDVRRQPYPRKVLNDEMAAVWSRQRWAKNGTDVLALRLQYGRGIDVADIAEQFDYSRKSLWQRVKDGKWSREMSNANRADLSRRVWLAGLARLGKLLEKFPGEAVSPGALERLREASDWQTLPPEKAMWVPVDNSAHELMRRPPVSQHELEKRGLLDDPANPDRTYRDKVAANLERLIARLERQKREKAEQAAAEKAEGEILAESEKA